jgi:hypothetical protein
MSAQCKGSKEKNPVAIAVRRTPLNKTLVYPSRTRTKVKTAVRSASARNWATQRLDETDFFSPARDDAGRITATDIMVIIANCEKSSNGRKHWGYCYKMWSKHGKEEQGPCAWTISAADRRDSKANQIFKLSRVPGPRVPIHARVSRDSARVAQCVVK